MAKSSAKPTGESAKIGHNGYNKTKDIVAKAANQIIKLKAERAKINAKIADERAGVAAEGIPKKAFAWALDQLESSPEQRAGFDLGYAISRDALQLPLEGIDMEELLAKKREEQEENA